MKAKLTDQDKIDFVDWMERHWDVSVDDGVQMWGDVPGLLRGRLKQGETLCNIALSVLNHERNQGIDAFGELLRAYGADNIYGTDRPWVVMRKMQEAADD